jgi:NAD(P)-dependent dehydrogenase (short-subunit alcohol dehydrogenase family)
VALVAGGNSRIGVGIAQGLAAAWADDNFQVDAVLARWIDDGAPRAPKPQHPLRADPAMAGST